MPDTPKAEGSARRGAWLGDRSSPLLELRDVTATFPGIVANREVSLTVCRGEIHGLLGENGAGKTTLMTVMAGLKRPDRGTVLVEGAEAVLASPRDARRLGIAMVHQQFSLCPSLTVAENVALGSDSRGVRLSRVIDDVERWSAHYGLPVDPRIRVADLTMGERQRVEILKCLLHRPRLLILDEPTSILGPAEVARLLALLRQLADEGHGILLSTHKLEEMVRATDRITVLRLGRVVGRMETRDADPPALARMMVGRPVSLPGAALTLTPQMAATSAGTTDGRRPPPALIVDDVTYRDPLGVTRLHDATVRVFPGEIVGVAGVEGNGQTALADIVSGMLTPSAGRVWLSGEDVTSAPPGRRSQAGLGVIPEDREGRGSILQMSIAENLMLREIQSGALCRAGVVRWASVVDRARGLMDEYGIVAPSPTVRLATLSGGNRQRVLLARELSCSPKVLLAAQPTRGLDVAGIENINARLQAAREQGTGVLLISSELEEIFALADRMVVLFRGRVVGTFRREEADLQEIGRLMAGVQ